MAPVSVSSSCLCAIAVDGGDLSAAVRDLTEDKPQRLVPGASTREASALAGRVLVVLVGRGDAAFGCLTATAPFPRILLGISAFMLWRWRLVRVGGFSRGGVFRIGTHDVLLLSSGAILDVTPSFHASPMLGEEAATGTAPPDPHCANSGAGSGYCVYKLGP